ncbi:MAG: hypothetical protein ACREBU_13300 [Nitrososphaera sp.]
MSYIPKPIDWETWISRLYPGIELAQWQKDAFVMYNNHSRIAIRAARGVGKTAWLSLLILYHMMTRFPTRILCTAPTQNQLRDVLITELALWISRMPKEYRELFSLDTQHLQFAPAPSLSFATFRTSRPEKPETLQGIHGENVLIVCDESSGIEDAIFTAGQGSLSTPGSKVVLCSNPTRTSGFFHRACQNPELWNHTHVSFLDVEGMAWCDNGFPTTIAQEYGEDSDVYRVQVLGEFPRGDAYTLIPLELLESASQREVSESLGKDESLQIYWGLDVARFGSCRTALARRSPLRLLQPIETAPWGLDTVEVADWISEKLSETPRALKPQFVIVDAIGVGAGVADLLWRRGIPTIGLNVGEAPSKLRLQTKGFINLRAELWWRAAKWFEGRNVSICDRTLVNQLATVEYHYTKNDKLQIESKLERMARGLPSPDYADAFVLSFYCDVPRYVEQGSIWQAPRKVEVPLWCN